MSRVNCDVNALTAAISQVGERAVKGVSDIMRRYSALIEYTVKAYAPYDTGTLESAVTRVDHRDGNRRLSIDIFIDGEVMHPDGRPVSHYDQFIHENLAPVGLLNRGPGTVAKGSQAGGGYFVRALDKWLPDLMQAAERKVRSML